MSENPYSSPTNSSSAATHVAVDIAEPTLLTIARKTFLAWKKRRIAYVAILAVITILLIAASGLSNWRSLLLTVEGAVFANIAYFVGPTMETYIKWLGYDRSWPRWVMFTCGTLLSAILAVAALAAEILPDQD